MLEQRVLQTLRFFDYQQLPLTLYELHYFLIAPLGSLKPCLNSHGELVKIPPPSPFVSMETLEAVVRSMENSGLIEQELGYFSLAGSQGKILKRWRGYYYGARREKLIRSYCTKLSLLPFVRGVALAGSQALGSQREDSDIDLLVITDKNFMWTARTSITGYFHVLGLRRYGRKIANRFCLNHYLASTKALVSGRNLYTAMEYAKLRPLFGDHIIEEFQLNNAEWIKAFFPHALYGMEPKKAIRESSVLERVFVKAGAPIVEGFLKKTLSRRITLDTFVVVRDEELSFHPDSKQGSLLDSFFNLDSFQIPKAEAVAQGEVGSED